MSSLKIIMRFNEIFKGESIETTDDIVSLRRKRQRNDDQLTSIQTELNYIDARKTYLIDKAEEIKEKQEILKKCITVIEKHASPKCHYCFDNLRDKLLGLCQPCGHVYCFNCVEEAKVISEIEYQIDYMCPKCSKKVNSIKVITF